MKDEATLTEGLARVRAKFLTMVIERRARVATCADIARVRDLEDATEALEEAGHLLHQLAGTSGTLGFVPLGQAARIGTDEIRRALAEHRQGIKHSTPPLVMLLDAFVQECDAVLQG